MLNHIIKIYIDTIELHVGDGNLWLIKRNRKSLNYGVGDGNLWLIKRNRKSRHRCHGNRRSMAVISAVLHF